jgi:SAM-dependent methyltransferase
MFDLAEPDVQGAILDCPGGGSSFTSGACARGAEAIAVDPAYSMPPDELARLVIAETHRGTAHSVAGADRYNWDFYGGPAGHRALRQASAEAFAADLRAHPGRYVPGALPSLPFADGQFDLVLCSHLLFTYADRLDYAFHRDALLELHRVSAGQVRVFPLTDQTGARCEELTDRLRTELADSGIASDVRTVPYEFQRGGNVMLVLQGGERR